MATVVHDKLRDRHPHVFGSATFTSVDDLAADWEARKRVEKSRASVMDGIPAELPALVRIDDDDLQYLQRYRVP